MEEAQVVLHRNYQSQWLKSSRDVSSWNQMKTFAGLSPFTSLVSEHFKQWLIHIKQHCNGNSTSFFFTLCFSLKNMGSPQSFPEIDVLNQPFDSPSQIYICTFLVCISSENEYIYIFRIFTDRWNSYDHLQTEISSSNRVWTQCVLLYKQKGVEHAIFYTWIKINIKKVIFY